MHGLGSGKSGRVSCGRKKRSNWIQNGDRERKWGLGSKIKSQSMVLWVRLAGSFKAWSKERGEGRTRSSLGSKGSEEEKEEE
jgi:hypothetical protein